MLSGGIHMRRHNRAVGSGIRLNSIVQCPCALPDSAIFYCRALHRVELYYLLSFTYFMTLKKTGLFPTNHNDIWRLLGAFELDSGSRLQPGVFSGQKFCQCMTLEPSPQIFDRIQVGRIRRQECQLDMPVQSILNASTQK